MDYHAVLWRFFSVKEYIFLGGHAVPLQVGDEEKITASCESAGAAVTAAKEESTLSQIEDDDIKDAASGRGTTHTH